jgi:Fe2+ or Zn2+ uptake regulation protein
VARYLKHARSTLPVADSDDDLAAAVLAYLSECPSAMETAEGVTEWWVMRQRVRAQVEAVARVLDSLVARGVLERVESGERPRYRLKQK